MRESVCLLPTGSYLPRPAAIRLGASQVHVRFHLFTHLPRPSGQYAAPMLIATSSASMPIVLCNHGACTWELEEITLLSSLSTWKKKRTVFSAQCISFRFLSSPPQRLRFRARNIQRVVKVILYTWDCYYRNNWVRARARTSGLPLRLLLETESVLNGYRWLLVTRYCRSLVITSLVLSR